MKTCLYVAVIAMAFHSLTLITQGDELVTGDEAVGPVDPSATKDSRDLRGDEVRDGAPMITFEPLIAKEAAEAYHGRVFSSLPEPSSIAKMTAEVHHNDSASPDFEIKEFEVPKQFYGDILEEFRRGRIDRDPNTSLYEVGTIVITSEAGYKRRLSWYGGAQAAPFMFSLNGVRCTTDRKDADGTLIIGASKLMPIIREAAKSAQPMQE